MTAFKICGVQQGIRIDVIFAVVYDKCVLISLYGSGTNTAIISAVIGDVAQVIRALIRDVVLDVVQV